MKTFLQYFFLLFLNITTMTICGKTIPPVHSRCIKDQQLSLLHLKKSLIFNEDSYYSYPTKVISWNSSTDCCSWPGMLFVLTLAENLSLVALTIPAVSSIFNIFKASIWPIIRLAMALAFRQQSESLPTGIDDFLT
ncbi:hypothetical protein L3X38_035021 [Prunus dulcis]|uniref:Leucine-rich repeat-containing N-terminal plant-type domain-containing protein n=1 Tax=Prunus dulcis TaxID=3755 RepID=A0AAD4VKM8_PRUDU|nr:hypothetical protein L3X38_035021 [Prunus dulcis]